MGSSHLSSRTKLSTEWFRGAITLLNNKSNLLFRKGNLLVGAKNGKLLPCFKLFQSSSGKSKGFVKENNRAFYEMVSGQREDGLGPFVGIAVDVNEGKLFGMLSKKLRKSSVKPAFQ